MTSCMSRPGCGPPVILATWLALLLLSLVSRNALPVDETRYLGVAWEMWLRGDFLVPYLNGEPYAHKPPLLFWLINLSWGVFGVSEWAARLVTAVAGLAGAGLALALGRQLWPRRNDVHLLAVWALFSTLLWALWTTALMFDLLIAVCAELAWLGILLSWRGRAWGGWMLSGLGIGLGVLAKGPVILVYVLPATLLAPLWADEQRPASWWRWYGGSLLAVLGGAALALAWALPAAFAGGDAYRDAILWGQTADRMVQSFAHQRPFWWYLPMLPVLLYPWILWGPLWRGVRRRLGEGLDAGERFALVTAAGGLLIFTLISGKQVHYLLPFMPLPALLGARALCALPAGDRAPRWNAIVVVLPLLLLGLVLAIAPLSSLARGQPLWVAQMSPLWGLLVVAAAMAAVATATHVGTAIWPGTVTLLLLAALYPGFLRDMAEHYEINTMATRVAEAQQSGRPVAFVGNYNGEFNFAGRLKAPVDQVRRQQLPIWISEHPGGVVVARAEMPPSAAEEDVLHWESYRSSYLVLREAATAAVHANPKE